VCVIERRPVSYSRSPLLPPSFFFLPVFRTQALAAMELQQMVVQGRWNTDSPLLQIPHFTAAMVAECNSAVLQRDDDDDEEEDESEIAHVESVYDILEMGDEQRTHILRSLSAKQQSDVAAFCNAYVVRWCHHSFLRAPFSLRGLSFLFLSSLSTHTYAATRQLMLRLKCSMLMILPQATLLRCKCSFLWKMMKMKRTRKCFLVSQQPVRV